MPKNNTQKHQALVSFDKNEKDIIVKKIQLYFQEELEQNIGAFDAEFLLDFFSEEIGVFYYNRGLYDAQGLLESRIDDIRDSILDLEKTTPFEWR